MYVRLEYLWFDIVPIPGLRSTAGFLISHAMHLSGVEVRTDQLFRVSDRVKVNRHPVRPSEFPAFREGLPLLDHPLPAVDTLHHLSVTTT